MESRIKVYSGLWISNRIMRGLNFFIIHSMPWEREVPSPMRELSDYLRAERDVLSEVRRTFFRRDMEASTVLLGEVQSVRRMVMPSNNKG